MSIERVSEQLRDRMTQWYGVRSEQVKIVFSPYRICPLGAHIDHQLGTVTAMALDHGVWLAFVPRDAPEVNMRSLDFEGEVHVRFDDVAPPRVADWGNYVRGAILALRRDFGVSEGLVGITAGRVAEGGLSSSAAVGVAYLLALQDVNQLTVTPEQNIALVQRIENHYLGLHIGILDQSAILLSRRNALTVIDCADVTHSLIQWPTSPLPFGILIVFSGLRQSLVGTDYNQRVTECTEAARQLLRAAGRPEDPPRLGSVTPPEYQAHAARLSGPPARRAQHFFSEMERVRRGVAVWNQGDVQTFGKLVTESGASSIHHYECGSPPLIDLYHALIETPGVYGARFSGAGFRGCCLGLIDPARAEEIAARVLRVYARRHPALASSAWSMVCHTDDGARFLESP